jgi:hypothetical protein
MLAQEAAYESFVIVWAHWTVDQAVDIVERLEPEFVVFRRVVEQDTYYYLLTIEEFRDRVERIRSDASVEDGFDLHETDAASVASPLQEVSTSDQAVLVEDDRIVGLLYPRPAARRHAPGATRGRVRGPTRGADEPADAASGRTLWADFPDRVTLDEEVSLLVTLGALEAVAGKPSLSVDLPSRSVIDLIVAAKQRFEPVGSMEGTIEVPETGNSVPVQFKLKATSVGRGIIDVFAFHKGQNLGKMTIVSQVVTGVPAEAPERRQASHTLDSPRAHQPDLSMTIIEMGSQSEYSILINSPEGQAYYGPIKLRSNPRSYFQELYQDIEDLPVDTSAQRAEAEQRLAARGATLYEAVVPDEIRKIIWQTQSRIKTVQIQSQEPWIPWEICRLSYKDDQGCHEGPFLCEAFETTRWLLNVRRQPSIRLSKIALVVPRDSGLPFATAERDYIRGLANGGRSVTDVPAQFGRLHAELRSGVYDAWHFTGHGFAPAKADANRTQVILEGNKTITPEELGGDVQNLGRAKPFVFLNACQIGRSAMSLTDIGGFAYRFLHAGAAAFIGAYWSVYDEPALRFAEALYDALLQRKTAGRATLEARTKIKNLGPTWLAYTVYADPFATVQQESIA